MVIHVMECSFNAIELQYLYQAIRLERLEKMQGSLFGIVKKTYFDAIQIILDNCFIERPNHLLEYSEQMFQQTFLAYRSWVSASY